MSLRLVKDAEYGMIIRNATESDKAFIHTQQIANHNSFISNYSVNKKHIQKIRENHGEE